MIGSSTNIFQDGEVTIEQENESLKQQVEELLAKVEAMTKKETDLSYKLAELSDEYKRQGARFKRETEKTKVSQSSETVPFQSLIQNAGLIMLFRFMPSKILQKIYFQLLINLFWRWITLKRCLKRI